MSEKRKTNCPVCSKMESEIMTIEGGNDLEECICPRCGTFRASGQFMEGNHGDVDWIKSRHIVSGILRERELRGMPVLTICSNEIGDLIKSFPIPETPGEKAKRLLFLLSKIVKEHGKTIPFKNYKTLLPLCYAEYVDQLHYYLTYLQEKGYINNYARLSGSCDISVNGWDFIYDYEKRINSTQAFVAMWFDDRMDDAYKEAIRPALEKLGYDPIINVKFMEHNEKIDDIIIAEIRKSRLLIAEFSGHRPCVYFEAGFAKGLGIDVIFICHKKYFKKAQFDIRQYSHIKWEYAEELKEKLIKRIGATIPFPSQ